MARRLLLEDEVDGDCQGTTDFVFCRIGDPVRLMPVASNSVFDLSDPPLQPLVVSEGHRLLFLAHSEGFLVANTKDVIELAKSSANGKGKDLCIQKSCVVDVRIGRVSILSLSWDSSILAASVGGDIHLFTVQSLIDKVKEPAISAPLNKSGIAKDLKWRRNSENSFIVLSSDGSLYHGSSGLQLKHVIDNVDAVDWSVDGNYVAIARKDTVCILTSNFDEILDMPLLFQSWTVDSGSEIKVDSIKWIRHDSIVIGCIQMKENCEDSRYLVQVIVSGEHNFTEASCNPLVFSFPDLFEGLSDDMLPPGVGPYLLSDYLDCWDVSFTCNKRNVDQHISLLRWIVEDTNYEVVSLELGSDKYIPRIDLQDDGDDNLVFGLAVDKVSLYEKIKVQLDLEFKELSPRCILLCLTCDGKLTLYHAAWISEPSDIPKVASSHGDNIGNVGLPGLLLAESDLEITTSRLNDEQHAAISAKIHSNSDKLNIDEDGKMGHHGTLNEVKQCSHPRPGMMASGYSSRPDIEEPNLFSGGGDRDSNLAISETVNESLSVKGFDAGKSIGLNFTLGTSVESQIVQKPIGINGSNVSASYAAKEAVASENLGSTINLGHTYWSQPSKSYKVDASKIKPSPGESKFSGIVNETLYSPPRNSPPDLPTCSQSFGILPSSQKINQNGLPASINSGCTGPTSILNNSPLAALARQQLPLASSTYSKPHQMLEPMPQFSKQFYNVKDVTKELDALLSSIECEGGFKDLCSVIQEQSLLALEAGLHDLSELLFVHKNKVENQLLEIQLLRNKMLEVSARQAHMKYIVQQASDNRYWDIWNTQKLCPEFEAKQLHISNLKQNLINQLVELERHFNSLEINRFGEYNVSPTGWRVSCSSSPSRPTQSLHSVYRTVNSQLGAAEQLSECLSKQMAVLNITSPVSEKRKFTKELFESIGLDPKSGALMSPGTTGTNIEPYSSKSYLSTSTVLNEHHSKCASTSLKAFESSRRERDSLDKGWAHFKPTRTTVKRTSNTERVSRSNLGITFKEAKEVFDSQMKAFDIARTGMSNFSRTSSEPFNITKRTNMGATSMSKTTSTYSQSFDHSPDKGIQEKSSKKAVDVQSKSIFKSAKDQSDPSSESNTISSSQYSHGFRSPMTQPSSFAVPAIFSNSSSSKDEKSGSLFMRNMLSSSPVNQSSSSVTKTSLVSKPSVSTHQKFSDSVSPLKTASAAEKRSQSYQENLAVPLSTPLTSIAQSSASLTSSSLPSFQFEKPMVPGNFLSPSKSNTPASSNELAFKSVPSFATVHTSEGSQKPNEIGSELQSTSQSANIADSAKKLGSELKTDASQTFVGDTLPPRKDFKLQHNTSQSPDVSAIHPKIEFGGAMPSGLVTTEKDEQLDGNLSQEDEMEEEAVDTNSVLNLESLGGFSSQSTPSSNVLKPNPFGSPFVQQSAGSTRPLSSWNNSTGQLFRPSSFNLPESQPSQFAGSNSLTGVASGGFSGFGQPAQLGAGQQALGSVLGSFGQSRQLGAGMPGFGFASSGIPAAGSSGGSVNTGGFAGAGTGGGFAGLFPNKGGFAGAASFTGGFGGVASAGGGFGGASSGGGFGGASSGGGFGGASPGGGFGGASSGGGFAGASSGSGFSTGGFGGFSNIQGGGFSGFGAAKSGAGRPPAELLTQMRK